MGKLNKSTYKTFDSQEVDNREHDVSLSVKKIMPYGWTGSAAVAESVDASGHLQVDVLTSPTTTTTHGKTLKTVTGTVAADTDIVSAVASKRIKVIAITLISASTTANTITFQSNASTALATYPLQAITGTNFGVAIATSAPSFLFATVAGEKLTLDVSAAVNVTYTVTYFDDDAA